MGSGLEQFFDRGIGKFILASLLLLIISCAFWLLLAILFQGEYRPHELFPLHLNQDLRITKNPSGYEGYIRFEGQPVIRQGIPSKLITKVKIVLKVPAQQTPQQSIRVEILGTDRNAIASVFLDRKNFAPLTMGYSYNILDPEFSQTAIQSQPAYFRYNLVDVVRNP